MAFLREVRTDFRASSPAWNSNRALFESFAENWEEFLYWKIFSGNNIERRTKTWKVQIMNFKSIQKGKPNIWTTLVFPKYGAHSVKRSRPKCPIFH